MVRSEHIGARDALDGLEDDGSGLAVDGGSRPGRVVARREGDVERGVREAVPALPGPPGHGGSGGRTAVEPVFQRHYAPAARQLAGQPEGVLVGLRSRIDEEDAVQAVRREPGQLVGGARPHPQGVHIAGEHQFARLPAHGFQNLRVSIAESAHRVPAVEIEQPAPVRTSKIRAPAGNRLHRQLAVHLGQMPRFGLARVRDECRSWCVHLGARCGLREPERFATGGAFTSTPLRGR